MKALTNAPLLAIHADDVAWLDEQHEKTILELGIRLSLLIFYRRESELLATIGRPDAHLLPVEILGYYVGAAKSAGASWQQIGDQLGVSRQAAHKRFSAWVIRYDAAAEAHRPSSRGTATERLRNSKTYVASPKR